MKYETPLNGWILNKINSYLSNREGCSVETIEYTADGARTIVQDVLGFRYEVQIKTIGRQVPAVGMDEADGIPVLPRGINF